MVQDKLCLRNTMAFRKTQRDNKRAKFLIALASRPAGWLALARARADTRRVELLYWSWAPHERQQIDRSARSGWLAVVEMRSLEVAQPLLARRLELANLKLELVVVAVGVVV